MFLVLNQFPKWAEIGFIAERALQCITLGEFILA
jgi:hypothetical protein